MVSPSFLKDKLPDLQDEGSARGATCFRQRAGHVRVCWPSFALSGETRLSYAGRLSALRKPCRITPNDKVDFCFAFAASHQPAAFWKTRNILCFAPGGIYL
jgi:hypothetical protein